ncbi:MAG: methionyl-tRNA formyltransferase [Alphaproteobacteria bacterium]|nr:methionyl-tRNA formyltransferase [Alphaproteobacteria bacterium]
MRLAFLGTPDFAVPALRALAQAGHDLVRVYTQPPRPAGRGHAERPSAVHRAAKELGIPVAHPVSLKDPAIQQDFAALGLDVGIVVAYGLILPRAVLDAPRLGCINIHASLLPRWRGAAPIQRAILAGDRETGVTIMQMDAGLDTGPMLLREAMPIAPDDTGGTLHDKLAALGARMIVEALARLEAGMLERTPQPAEGATYAAKIDKTETRLDWRRPADELVRVVRAFAPAPGAWFALPGPAGAEPERVRVLAAETDDGDGAPGTVLDETLTIACGAGALRPTLVQRAGKGAMATEAFLRGRGIPRRTVLP